MPFPRRLLEASVHLSNRGLPSLHCSAWPVVPDREVKPGPCSLQRALHKLLPMLSTGRVSRGLRADVFCKTKT